MKVHELAPPSGATRERRRIGRGHGSGRVKTGGAGTKGQNARSGKGVKPFFEGGQNPWTMKIPRRRGFSHARFRREAQIVNLSSIERTFGDGDTVTPELLERRGLIRDGSGAQPVKLLGDGMLSKRVHLQVHAASAAARAAVEGAGGTLKLLDGGADQAGAAGGENGADGVAAREEPDGSHAAGAER
jgi:large subunit ribosomal protein L15